MGGFPAVEIFKCADAPWVLFIHTIGGSANTWKEQTEAFSANYNLLLAELHCEHGDETLTMEGVCERLFVLLNERGIKRIYIVSICGSSLIALAFAALYPDMVGGMVMVSGILALNKAEKDGVKITLLLKNIAPYMLAYRIMAWLIMPGKIHRKSRRILIQEARKIGRDEFRRWVEFFPTILDNDSYIARFNSLKSPPPSLYIMGAGDKRWLPLIRQHIDRLNNARIEALPECGHVCMMDRPDIFNKTTLDFIGTLIEKEQKQ